MKKLLTLTLVALMATTLTTFAGSGTQADPYTIAEARALPEGSTMYYAQGYIVGGRYNDFDAPWANDYGISCADSDSETDVNNCLQVKLEDIADYGRADWGLNSNPGKHGMFIVFHGYRDAYGTYPSFEGVDFIEESGGGGGPATATNEVALTSPSAGTVTIGSPVTITTESVSNHTAQVGYGSTTDGSDWLWFGVTASSGGSLGYTATKTVTPGVGTHYFGARWIDGAITNYGWNSAGQVNKSVLAATIAVTVVTNQPNQILPVTWDFSTADGTGITPGSSISTNWGTSGGGASCPLNEDFADASGFSVTLGGLGSDGNKDYFMITDGSDINKTYTGFSGNFIAGQDINDGGWPGSASPSELTWSGIDIDGLSDLVFTGLFASVATDKIDADEYVHVQYRIDSGSWTDLLWFENDGTTYNTYFLEDTDFDGDGDGTQLTSAAAAFGKSIPGTGSTLDLRITVAVEAGDEDIAFDSFTVCGSGGGGGGGYTGILESGDWSHNATRDANSSLTFAYDTPGLLNPGFYCQVRRDGSGPRKIDLDYNDGSTWDTATETYELPNAGEWYYIGKSFGGNGANGTEFRLVGYAATASELDIKDVIVTSPVPEPGIFAIVLLGAAAFIRRSL